MGRNNKKRGSFRPYDLSDFAKYDGQSNGRSNDKNSGYRTGSAQHDSQRTTDQQFKASGHQIRERNSAQYDYQRSGGVERNGETKSNHHKKERRGQDMDGNSAQQSLAVSTELEPKRNSRKWNALACFSCEKYFNSGRYIPRSLPCGHTLCNGCLEKHLARFSSCSLCKGSFSGKKVIDDFPVNYAVMECITEENRYNTNEIKEGKQLCQPVIEPSKPVVTIGSDKQISERTKNVTSPHNSRCLEVGEHPSYHCAVCKKWVCEKCGNIDHNQRKCHLIPKKEAISQMSRAHLNQASKTLESLENSLTELTKYEKCLDSLSLVMQAAFESISTEKECIREMKDEATKRKISLDSASKEITKSRTVPQTLDALNLVEDKCKATLNWQEEKFYRLLDQGNVKKMTKEILLSTVYMKLMAEREDKPSGKLLAECVVNGVRLYSYLESSGGRILVHSLRKVNSVPAGSRAISLTSILECLDPASSLTFLDIGVNEMDKRRVYIRLTGDTLRGRQFLALCTGSYGPSLCRTNFHRVWWKGNDGEHVWGGDYEKGNGSGGTPILTLDEEEKDEVPQGRKLQITPGLVAGRYEDHNVSSIFRIYTKGCRKYKELDFYDSFAQEDENGFGYVEDGLPVLQDAIKQGNIQAVKIFDCGIVIET